MWSNITFYSMQQYRNWDRTSITLYSQNTPHTSPYGWAMGCLLWVFWRKLSYNGNIVSCCTCTIMCYMKVSPNHFIIKILSYWSGVFFCLIEKKVPLDFNHENSLTPPKNITYIGEDIHHIMFQNCTMSIRYKLTHIPSWHFSPILSPVTLGFAPASNSQSVTWSTPRSTASFSAGPRRRFKCCL